MGKWIFDAMRLAHDYWADDDQPKRSRQIAVCAAGLLILIVLGMWLLQFF